MNLQELNKQIEQIETELNDSNLCANTASTLTRISGYYRAVENWNTGKRAEFDDRVQYQFD
jgi:anaerobic ribonucleoside-triphosphate reductase